MSKIYVGFTYGIAASGKSTLVKIIQRTNTFPGTGISFPEHVKFEVLATDKIREEVYPLPLSEAFKGIDPTKGDTRLDPELEKRVFEIFTERLKDRLTRGQHVILDATFLSRAARMINLKDVRTTIDNSFCFLMIVDTPLKTILEWNKKRANVVPVKVIKQMYITRSDINEQPNINTERWDLVYYYEPLKHLIEHMTTFNIIRQEGLV